MAAEIDVPSLFSDSRVRWTKDRKPAGKFSLVRENSKYKVAVGNISKKCHLNTGLEEIDLSLDEVSSLIDDLNIIRKHMAELAMKRLLQPSK